MFFDELSYMIKKINRIVIIQLNKMPLLKRTLLYLMNFYYKFAPRLYGNLTRNPAYLIHLFHSKVVAKPGTLNFKGGAFNPGAILIAENKILLLARAQIVPWFKARGKKRNFYMVGNPVSFLLNSRSLKIEENSVITSLIGFPNTEDYEIEDFRLFKWKGKIMVNHSLVTKGKVDGFINQKEVRSALSVFDDKENVLKFVVIPKIDFPLQNFEKNWVYKENGSQLLLFYSLNPYKVLALEQDENFSFKTILKNQLRNKLINPGGFGTLVSLSTNPIDFDEKHWLIIIHQIEHRFTGRCYFHWAVLIDQLTFLPVKITSKPLFSGKGARGRSPGIRYISSIIKVKEEILFFGGEGDVYVTVTKKTIQELNTLFVPL